MEETVCGSDFGSVRPVDSTHAGVRSLLISAVKRRAALLYTFPQLNVINRGDDEMSRNTINHRSEEEGGVGLLSCYVVVLPRAQFPPPTDLLLGIRVSDICLFQVTSSDVRESSHWEFTATMYRII